MKLVLGILIVSQMAFCENGPIVQGPPVDGSGLYGMPSHQQGYGPQAGYIPQQGFVVPQPGLAPGVYRSQYSTGGGRFSPWGRQQWSSEGDSTFVVPPPMPIFPRPYYGPAGFPGAVMPPCNVPPVCYPPMNSCLCPPVFQFGAGFGF